MRMALDDQTFCYTVEFLITTTQLSYLNFYTITAAFIVIVTKQTTEVEMTALNLGEYSSFMFEHK